MKNDKYKVEITPREAVWLESGLNHLCQYLEGVCKYAQTKSDWDRVKFIKNNMIDMQNLGKRLLRETHTKIEIIMPPPKAPDPKKN